MFVVKIDSSNTWVSNATNPSAVVIATSAISSGTTPATTVPNTSSRMISAAGSPNLSSPSSRSRLDSSLKS
jgi:hypothetical protein